MIQRENHARGAADIRRCRGSGDDVLVGAVLGRHLARVTRGEGIGDDEEQESQAENSKRPDPDASRHQERSLHDRFPSLNGLPGHVR
jgi:hypothetical protein